MVTAEKEHVNGSTDIAEVVDGDDEALSIGIWMVEVFPELIVATDNARKNTLIIAEQQESCRACEGDRGDQGFARKVEHDGGC